MQQKMDFQEKEMYLAKELNIIKYSKRYHLIIYIEQYNRIKIACIDLKNNECVLIKNYVWQNDKVFDFDVIYQQESLLQFFYFKITFCLQHDQFSLLPNYLVDLNYLKSYLKFTVPFFEYQEYAKSSNYLKLQLTTIFAIQKKLHESIQKRYDLRKVSIIPHPELFIGSAHYYVQKIKKLGLIVFILEKFVSISLVSEKKLYYYNHFPYRNYGEILNYLNKLILLFQLQNSTYHIRLFGKVDKITSKIFQKKLNFPHIKMLEKENNIFNNLIKTKIDQKDYIDVALLHQYIFKIKNVKFKK